MRVPFFVLLLSCLLVGLGVGLPLGSVVETMAKGFRHIVVALAPIIFLGIILGALLDLSGSTRVMAASILKKVGDGRAALAMNITGLIVGLPIFCDSGFIVLSGLNRSLAERTRVPMAFMTVSLASGLYAIHCLIPPHPGAAAAASLIGVDVGRLMLTGTLAAIPSAFAGYCWARFAGRGGKPGEGVKVSGSGGMSTGDEEIQGPGDDGKTSGNADNMIGKIQRPGDAGVTVTMAFLPVVVPILLIAIKPWIGVPGTPVAALSVGILLAMICGRGWTKKVLGGLLWSSVKKAASILVIIGAGGAFGAVLATTHMGDQLGAALPLARMGIFFPFLLTSLLKTAQGSSTVAIITAASIVKPVLTTLGLATGNGPILCILSMGAGSMMISHANDAYFWVIARFSGLDMRTMLKVYTVATLLMGVTAYLTVYLISCI